MTPIKRMAVALLTLQKLREAIEANGNYYHGGLVPNLMSVQDVLTLPDSLLDDQLTKIPEIVPTDAQLTELAQLHAQ